MNLSSLDTKISMSIKKNLIDFIVKIMSDHKCKTNVDSLLCDEILFFMYDVKTTKPEQFPDSEIFYVDSFQVCTGVTVNMQLQSWNYKLKRANEVTFRYSFKPVSL